MAGQMSSQDFDFFIGHETIAYVASNFVSSATMTYFQDILGDTSASYLASVAPWA